jgi:hypothetical protein
MSAATGAAPSGAAVTDVDADADAAAVTGAGRSGDPVADRLDRIAARLDDLAGVVEAERLERARWAELVHEMTPVAQAAMGLASDELAELTRDVTVEDATRFARTLVRSLPQLEVLLVQLVGAQELVGDLTSLAGAGMGALSDALGEADRRGYFTAAREGGAVLDRMAVAIAEPAPREVPSAMALLRQARDPDVRRGFARALDLLRALGAAPGADAPGAATTRATGSTTTTTHTPTAPKE